MNLFKKLFSKKKAANKKKAESWYNNYNEQEADRWVETPEGAAFGQSGNQLDNTIVRTMIKKGKL